MGDLGVLSAPTNHHRQWQFGIWKEDSDSVHRAYPPMAVGVGGLEARRHSPRERRELLPVQPHHSSWGDSRPSYLLSLSLYLLIVIERRQYLLVRVARREALQCASSLLGRVGLCSGNSAQHAHCGVGPSGSEARSADLFGSWLAPGFKCLQATGVLADTVHSLQAGTPLSLEHALLLY